MSEADSLRMVAEVVDRFSGPLRNLRAQLQGIRPGDGLRQIEGAARTAESAVKAAGDGISSTLTPALGLMGVTGLSAAAAMAGVGSALRAFGGNVSALAMIGREVGMTADQLRQFQAIGGKFKIDPEAMNGAAKAFAENMRDMRRGFGENFGWLQAQGPAGIDLAYKLMRSKNNDEAAKLVEDFMERLPNGVDRQRFAQRLFGNGDLGRLGSGVLGPLGKVRDELRAALGPLDGATVKAAEDFDRAMSGLATTMKKLGTSIATEAMPYFAEFATAVKGLVDDGRKDVTGQITSGIHDLGEALKKISWKDVGSDLVAFLRSVGTVAEYTAKGIGTVVAGVKGIIEAGRAAREFTDKYGFTAPKDAGSSQRRLDERIGGVRAKITESQEQRTLLLDVLKEAEEAGDKNKTAQLKEALSANSDKLKQLDETLRKLTDQGATVQQQSFNGGAGGLAGLIQRASFGGGGFSAPRLPVSRGGGGGGLGAPGNDNEPQFRVSPRSGGPGEQTREAVRAFREGRGRTPFDRKAPQIMRRLMEDFGLTREQASGIVGNLGHESAGFTAYQEKNPVGGGRGGAGWAQWTGKRRRAFEAWAAENKLDPTSDDASYGFLKHELGTTERKSLEAVRRQQTVEGAAEAFERGFERSGVKAWGSRFKFARRAYEAGPGEKDDAPAKGGWPSNWRPDTERSPDQPEAPDWSRGVGKSFDAFRGSALMLDKAKEKGVVGGGGPTVNAPVHVNVERPGPDTRVKTQSDGELFREVRLNRARSMTMASQVA